MIDTLHYGIGFIIYVTFCLITFDAYSKKKEITKFFILIMIYVYYSILAIYVINFVDFNGTKIEIFFQSMIYLFGCGLYLFQHYNYVIKKNDDDMFGNSN